MRAALNRPLRILELRTVRGTGGGPEKTILLGTARTDPSRYAISVCYIRDRRDQQFHIDSRAIELPIDYVEVIERHSFDPSIWGELTRLVKTKQIDIVHGHDYKTDFLAWLLWRRLGIIPMATAHGWTGHTIRERAVYYPADRWLLARFPRVAAVSSDIRNNLIAAGAHPHNVRVVLNAIDPFVFRRAREREPEARRLFNVVSDDLVIGTVGRLEPQKEFHRLITVFAAIAREMPHARLLIAGEGSLREALSAQIDRLGIGASCRLLGHVRDVPLFHHALDLFVQSSSYEGTPNVVLEAMAFETPIVATNAGGTAEIARDGLEALIVPIRDDAALDRALRSALTDRSAVRRRVVAARQRVEGELSFDSRLRRIESLYDELAAHFIDALPDKGAIGHPRLH
jgi:glycosyltransferase involved in cell wall biosynthesis